MLGNAHPADVILINQWSTRPQIAAIVRAEHSWNPHDVIVRPGLMNALIFLCRDVGVEEHLAPFRDHVVRRANALAHELKGKGSRYAEALSSAMRAVETSRNFAPGCLNLVSTVMCFREALVGAGRQAIQDTFGEIVRWPFLDSELLKLEDLDLAEVLHETLKANRFI